MTSSDTDWSTEEEEDAWDGFYAEDRAILSPRDEAIMRLFMASKRGFFDVAADALHAFPEIVNARNPYDDHTALMYASVFGHVKLVELFLENGADVTMTVLAQTALLLAARFGAFDCMELLLFYNSPVDEPDEFGQTALQWAAWKAHVESIHVLKLGGEGILDGTVGYQRFKNLLWAADSVDMTPIFQLVRHGARIDLSDHFSGDTVMHRCTVSNQVLLQEYASKLWCLYPLHRSIYLDDTETLLQYLDEHAQDEQIGSFRTEDGWAAVHLAVFLRRYDMVKELIARDPSCARLTIEGSQCTAWHIAASNGHVEIMKILIS